MRNNKRRKFLLLVLVFTLLFAGTGDWFGGNRAEAAQKTIVYSTSRTNASGIEYYNLPPDFGSSVSVSSSNGSVTHSVNKVTKQIALNLSGGYSTKTGVGNPVTLNTGSRTCSGQWCSGTWYLHVDASMYAMYPFVETRYSYDGAPWSNWGYVGELQKNTNWDGTYDYIYGYGMPSSSGSTASAELRGYTSYTTSYNAVVTLTYNTNTAPTYSGVSWNLSNSGVISKRASESKADLTVMFADIDADENTKVTVTPDFGPAKTVIANRIGNNYSALFSYTSSDFSTSGTITSLSIKIEDSFGGVTSTIINRTIIVDNRNLVYYDKYSAQNYTKYTGTDLGLSAQERIYAPGISFLTVYQGYTIDANGVFSGTGQSKVIRLTELEQGNGWYLPQVGNIINTSGWYGYPANMVFRLNGSYSDQLAGTYIYSSGFSAIKKGSIVQYNLQALDGDYPADGLHSDGYWYVKKLSTNRSPILNLDSGDLLKKADETLSVTGKALDYEGGILSIKAVINEVEYSKTINTSANVSSDWSLDIPTNQLGEGYKTVAVSLTDSEGASSDTITRVGTVLVDYTKPTNLKIIKNTQGWSKSDVTVTLTMEDNFPGYSIFYSLNNKSSVRYTEPFKVSEEGLNTLTVTGRDLVGNPAESVNENINIDKTPPTKPTVTLSSVTYVKGPVTFSISGSTALSPVSYKFRVDNGEWSEGTSGSVTEKGVHFVEAKAVSEVGLESSVTQSTVYVDNDGPVVSISPRGTTWRSTGLSIQVQSEDLQSGVKDSYYSWTDGEEPNSWQVLPNDGILGHQQEGQKYLFVRSSDNAGNSTVEKSDLYQLQSAPQPVDTEGFKAVATSDSEVKISIPTPLGSYLEGYVYKLTNEQTGKVFNLNNLETEVKEDQLKAGEEYNYELVVNNHTGSVSAKTSVIMPPAPVAGLTVTPADFTGNEVLVEYEGSKNAKEYNVVVTEVNSGTEVTNITTDQLSYQVEMLNPGNHYSVEVYALNASGRSSGTTKTFLTLPETPQGFKSVTIDVHKALLQWFFVESATSYNLYRGDSKLSSTAEVQHLDENLESGTEYDYQVSSENETGESVKSEVLKVKTLPDSVMNLKLSDITQNRAKGSWDPVTGADDFYTELFEDLNSVQTETVTEPSLDLSILEAGKTYTLVVKARNISGYGETQSITFTTIPEEIRDSAAVIVTPSEDSAVVAFPTVQGADNYKLTVNGKDIVVTSSPAQVEGLLGSTKYTLQLSPGNSNGYADPVSVEFLTKPISPSGLVMSEITDTGAKLSWNKDDTAIGYRVSYKGQDHDLDGTSQVLENLIPGEKTIVEVITINASGESTKSSIEVMTLPSKPDKPTVTVTKNSSAIKWKSVEGASSYTLEDLEGNVAYSGEELETNLLDLSQGKTFDYKLYAVNSLGDKSEPTEFKFTTTLSAPVGIITGLVTVDNAELYMPSIEYPLDHYLVERSDGYLEKVKDFGDFWSNTGLKANTEYDYVITPVNAGGNGESVTVSLKTPTVAVSLSDVKVEHLDTGEIEVSFPEVEGARKYIVRDDGKVILESNSLPLVFNDLSPGVKHVLEITTDNGSDVESAPTVITILTRAATPVDVKVEYTHNSATISFPTLPEFVTRFIIKQEDKEVAKSEKGTSVSVLPLKPSTQYIYMVYAENESGVSKEGLELKFSTNPAPVIVSDSSTSNNYGSGSNVPPKSEDKKAEPKKDEQPKSSEPKQSDAVYQFNDISNTFARNEINTLAQKGILKGVSATEYAPDKEVTRVELAALLVRAKEVSPDEALRLTFSDISQSAWYMPELNAAIANGIAKGFSEKSFGPLEPVTREQASVMFVNAKTGAALKQQETAVVFSDSAKIAEWAIDSVIQGVKGGIINGYPDGSFKPKGNLTRAETAAMLYRWMEE